MPRFKHLMALGGFLSLLTAGAPSVYAGDTNFVGDIPFGCTITNQPQNATLQVKSPDKMTAASALFNFSTNAPVALGINFSSYTAPEGANVLWVGEFYQANAPSPDFVFTNVNKWTMYSDAAIPNRSVYLKASVQTQGEPLTKGTYSATITIDCSSRY